MNKKYCIALDIAEDMDEKSLEYGVHYLMDGGMGGTLKEMRHFDWKPKLFDSIPEARSELIRLGSEWDSANLFETTKIQEWDQEHFDSINKSALDSLIN